MTIRLRCVERCRLGGAELCDALRQVVLSHAARQHHGDGSGIDKVEDCLKHHQGAAEVLLGARLDLAQRVTLRKESELFTNTGAAGARSVPIV